MVKRHTSVNLNFRFIILKEALSIPNKINDVSFFFREIWWIAVDRGGWKWSVSMLSQALPHHLQKPLAGCLEVSFDGLQSCPQKE